MKLKMLKRKFESFFRFFRPPPPSTHKTKVFIYIHYTNFFPLFFFSPLICLVNIRKLFIFFSFAIYSPTSHMGIINLALLIFFQPKTISLMCVCVYVFARFLRNFSFAYHSIWPPQIIIFFMIKSTVKVYAFLLQISLVLFWS
jgi:hypothetical protein